MYVSGTPLLNVIHEGHQNGCHSVLIFSSCVPGKAILQTRIRRDFLMCFMFVQETLFKVFFAFLFTRQPIFFLFISWFPMLSYMEESCDIFFKYYSHHFKFGSLLNCDLCTCCRWRRVMFSVWSVYVCGLVLALRCFPRERVVEWNIKNKVL